MHLVNIHRRDCQEQRDAEEIDELPVFTIESL
jgi:hypothetical protein